MDFFRRIPTHMDYEGQKLAEKIFQTVILLFAVSGLTAGFVYEQFSLTIYSLAVGFLISALVTLPPWPMYRRHPLRWQKSTSRPGQKKKN